MVIDCPPTLGLLTVNALVAASHLLIPIQSSYFALEGTDDLLETIEKVRTRANPALRILGVLITMHDKRTSIARDIRVQIHKVFGTKVFNTVISKNVPFLLLTNSLSIIDSLSLAASTVSTNDDRKSNLVPVMPCDPT